MSDTSYLAMTDEDFLKQTAPDDAVSEEAPAAETTTDTTTTPAATEEAATDSTEPTATETTPAAETPVDETTPKASEVVKPEGSETPAPVKDAAVQTEDKTKEATPAKTTETTPDYEAVYKKIMAPFKANGKMIDLRSPEEAIQLMQMGANYTAKMQALVPHRKLLLMLENNGLADEGKLSFLIDLNKKDPEAIKRLIKDAKIDPLEIDTSVEPAYREGNHRVNDDEVAFHTALDDMKSNPTGQATLQVIHNNWDQASKELLWSKPEVMKIIHQQRESGIYDRIVAEVNRQKTLGQIGAGEAFIQSYKTIGDQMVAANAFADLGAPAAKPAPVVVATTVAAPKPTVTNSTQAAAASSTRSTTKSAKELINPLAMSDDEFLKQMKNRV